MRAASQTLADWELDLLNHAIESEGFKRKRRIESRESAAATLNQSKADLRTEKKLLNATNPRNSPSSKR
jgi:hypothetical protein